MKKFAGRSEVRVLIQKLTLLIDEVEKRLVAKTEAEDETNLEEDLSHVRELLAITVANRVT